MTKSILRLISYASIFCLFLSVFIACDNPETVSFQEKEKVKTTVTTAEQESIKIVVGAMITPSTGYAYYRQLLDYIGKKLGRQVEFIAQ